MLGCQNPSCMRRFCRHCLLTHLGEDEKDMVSSFSSSPAFPLITQPPCMLRQHFLFRFEMRDGGV
jgi:hypothetical protein